MTLKRVLTYTLAGAVILAPVSRATADTGSFVAGAAIGGLLGHLVTRDYQMRQVPPPSTVSPAPATRPPANTTAKAAVKPAAKAPSGIPATQTGRQVQTALAFFGFPVGTIDGKVGPQTRQAISSYQAYLGYPQTGQLTAFEQQFLLDAYARSAQSGTVPGSEAAKQLLKVHMAGLAAPETGLPSFAVSATPTSLATHCLIVAETARARGGYQTIEAIDAPVDVLHEQFCRARSETIATSRHMAAKVSNTSTEEIISDCKAFGPVMAPVISNLADAPRQEIVRDSARLLADTGADAGQMIDAARTCLGFGYETDDMDVALGAGVVLVTLGQGAYGELMGHHLAGGFGTGVAPDLAVDWYAAAFDAVDANGAVFAENDPDRSQLLRRAAEQAYDVAPKATIATQSASALPTFSGSN
ncbi:MAG: peptidoglycan-binding domain-containing protein [Pseudomonadota bacterium]